MMTIFICILFNVYFTYQTDHKHSIVDTLDTSSSLDADATSRIECPGPLDMDTYWKIGNWRNDILKEEAEKIDEHLKKHRKEEGSDFIIENVKYFFTNPGVSRKTNKFGMKDCVSS
jgi:hypothetical protein